MTCVHESVSPSASPHRSILSSVYVILQGSFHNTGPLQWEFRDHRWIPWQRPCNTELCCVVCHWPEQAVEQTVESPDIWDTMTLVWRHCNGINADSKRLGSIFQRGIQAYTTIGSPSLTHWGRVTHICVGKLTITASDNGLSPGRRQAIIWTNAGILLIGPLGSNFSEIVIAIEFVQLCNSTHAFTMWMMLDTKPLQHDWCSAQNNRYLGHCNEKYNQL